MSDWQKGDLALCVRGGFINGPRYSRDFPVRGAVYTVSGTWFSPLYGELFLVLPDAPNNCDIGPKWASSRFRKIPPLTDEERRQFLIDLDHDLDAVALEKIYRGAV